MLKFISCIHRPDEISATEISLGRQRRKERREVIFFKAGTSLNIIRVELFGTFRADSMSELRLRMIMDIRFDLIPVALIVPYIFAGGTDGQHPAQCFDLSQ